MAHKESGKQHVQILKHVKQCLTTNRNINGPSKLKINRPKISFGFFSKNRFGGWTH